MGNIIFAFGRFTLDPVARDLQREGERICLPASAFDCLVYLIEHRERPVGKDELIAAVWGRTEVSDNLLAQHVVRLRRVLDEDSLSIRTVPRVGYHWVAPTKVLSRQVEQDRVVPLVASPHPLVTDGRNSGARRRMHGAWVALAIIAFGLLWGGAIWWRGRSDLLVHDSIPPEALIVVLPANVEANGDWSWLRYGLMDIVANHLRAAGLRTVPSEAVIALYRDTASNDGEDVIAQRFNASLQIKPSIKLVDGSWQVHLDLSTLSGVPGGVDARAKDVLAASRVAADALITKLGVAAPVDAVTQLDDWLSRVSVARMDNQLDMAQKLIDNVPESWLGDPKVAYAQAMLECDRGLRQECEAHLTDLIDRVSSDKDSQLRGQVMDMLARRYISAGETGKAVSMVDQAIALLEKSNGGDFLQRNLPVNPERHAGPQVQGRAQEPRSAFIDHEPDGFTTRTVIDSLLYAFRIRLRSGRVRIHVINRTLDKPDGGMQCLANMGRQGRLPDLAPRSTHGTSQGIFASEYANAGHGHH